MRYSRKCLENVLNSFDSFQNDKEIFKIALTNDDLLEIPKVFLIGNALGCIKYPPEHCRLHC